MSRHLTVDGLPSNERTLRKLLKDVNDMFLAAKTADKQAAMQALRQRALIEAKLEQMKAAKGAGKTAKLSEEDLVNAIRREAERMPDGHLRVVVDVYLARRGFELVPVEG